MVTDSLLVSSLFKYYYLGLKSIALVGLAVLLYMVQKTVREGRPAGLYHICWIISLCLWFSVGDESVCARFTMALI